MAVTDRRASSRVESESSRALALLTIICVGLGRKASWAAQALAREALTSPLAAREVIRATAASLRTTGRASRKDLLWEEGVANEERLDFFNPFIYCLVLIRLRVLS